MMNSIQSKAVRGVGAMALVLSTSFLGACATGPETSERSAPKAFRITDGDYGVELRSNGREINVQAVRHNGDGWAPISRLKETYDCYGRDYRNDMIDDVAKVAPYSSKARKVARVLANKHLPAPEVVCGR